VLLLNQTKKGDGSTMKLIDRVGKYIVYTYKKIISLFKNSYVYKGIKLKKSVIEKEEARPLIYEGVTRNYIEKGISQ
jgi:hypothetical protein